LNVELLRLFIFQLYISSVGAMLSLLLLVTPALALPSIFAQQQTPLKTQDHSQGYEFDPLLHLPGTSPYFDAVRRPWYAAGALLDCDRWSG
jgi:hypothetical protein